MKKKPAKKPTHILCKDPTGLSPLIDTFDNEQWCYGFTSGELAEHFAEQVAGQVTGGKPCPVPVTKATSKASS